MLLCEVSINAGCASQIDLQFPAAPPASMSAGSMGPKRCDGPERRIGCKRGKGSATGALVLDAQTSLVGPSAFEDSHNCWVGVVITEDDLQRPLKSRRSGASSRS
jgi:hypothetical protein